MNNDTKWEAVECGELAHNDTVRLTHANGDVIHAKITGSYTDGAFGSRLSSVLADEGYSFERAVPERTLPTEDGIYANAYGLGLGVQVGNWPTVIYLDESGRWTREPMTTAESAKHVADEWNEQSNLVRLVPATDVEELRTRIDKVREYIVTRPYLNNAGKTAFLNLLEGEATDV